MSSLRTRPLKSLPGSHHLAVIAVVTLLSVAVAGWLGARGPRGHRATAVVQLETSGAPAGAGVDPVLSEVVVLTSRTVIGEAIEREGLRLVSGPSEAPAGASREQAIDYVLERLDAIPASSEGRIRVSFTSEDSSVARRTVNAVVQAYREASGEAARREAMRRMEFLAGELRVVDSLLPIAREEREKVLTREAETATKEAQLAALRTQEAVLSRALAGPDVARTVDSGALTSLPAMAGQPASRALFARLQSYLSERQALLATRSAQHPDVQRVNILLAATREDLLAAARARLASLQRQIVAIEEEVAAETASVPGFPVVAGEPILPASVEAMEQRAADMRDQYEAARAEAESIEGPVESVELATTTVPVRRVPWAQLVLGLVTGLLLGSGAAVAWDRVRADRGRGQIQMFEEPAPGEPPLDAGTTVAGETVVDPGTAVAAASADAETPVAVESVAASPIVAPLPNLAVIPEVRPSLVEPALNGDFRPGPLQVAGIEAYRSLRKNLASEWWGLKTLVVTSAHPGEGKTTTSTNLAATYARQGVKVVLVECDLRRPSLGRYFGITREVDLMDVLFEGQDWRSAIQLTNMPGLYVILGEKSFPRAGESLGGPEMKKLLGELSEEYDLVILDTSPLLVSTDAVVLGPLADAVLLVVRGTRTDRRTMVDVVRRLRESGANVIGTILNDPEGVGAPS